MANVTTDLPVVDFADLDASVIHAKTPRRAPKSKRPASHLTSSPEPPIPPTSPEELTSHPGASPPAPHGRERTTRQLYQERLESDPSYVPTVGEFWGHDDRLLDKDLRTLTPWWRGRWQGGARGRGFGFRRREHGHDRGDTNAGNDSHSTGEVTPSPQRDVRFSPRPGTACSTDSPTSTTPRTWYLVKPERPWTKHHELFLYSDPSLRPSPGQGPAYRVKLSGTHPEVIVQTPAQLSPYALTPPRELVFAVPLPRCERKLEATETKHIKYPNPDPNAVEPNERTTQLARKSSVGPPTQEQPQHPTSSSSDAYAPHSASPFQNATLGESGRPAFLQIAREQIPSLNGLSRCVPEEDDDSPEYRAKSAVPNNSFAAATLAALVERDRHVAQLTEELRELADRLFAQTSLVEQKDAELVDTRATLDKLLLSRDQHVRALEQTIAKYETELAEARADLGARESELEEVRSRLVERENGWAKGKKTAADTLHAPTTAGLVTMDEGARLWNGSQLKWRHCG